MPVVADMPKVLNLIAKKIAVLELKRTATTNATTTTTPTTALPSNLTTTSTSKIGTMIMVKMGVSNSS